MIGALSDELDVLARRHRLETRFHDGRGRWRNAPPDSVVAALDAIRGGPGLDPDASDRPRSPMIAPVVVAWDGAAAVPLRVAPAAGSRTLECALQLETGETSEWTVSVDELSPVEDDGPDRRRRHLQRFELERLPFGCHELRLACGAEVAGCWVLSAPRTAWRWSDPPGVGVFAPLHALHSEDSWGVGDFSDLERFGSWLATLGARSTAVLPLLPVDYTGSPCDPSPYRPVSRLFWNELFVDPRRLPEFDTCVAARELAGSTGFTAELDRIRRGTRVDYQGALSPKRRVLALLAGHAVETPARWSEVEHWADGHAWARSFARFRASRERPLDAVAPWPESHHLYAQWAAHRQIDVLSDNATGLYLDLPLGVAPDGFDPAAFPAAFARGVETGAPPDELFPEGQAWGTPPPHPETARLDGYRYLRASLAHHLSAARALRLDHVMSLHRLYWVPSGASATDGVYVHYPAEELQAVVTIESWRHQTPVVGENLGTVPDYVNETLARRGLGRLHVGQFHVRVDAPAPLDPAPPGAVVSLNTHDTPTFAGFLAGRDIEERRMRGACSTQEAEQALERRGALAQALRRFLPTGTDTDAAALLRACLQTLAQGEGDLLLVTLEDLWLETRPQNVPGTGPELENWRGRAARSLDEVMADGAICGLLTRLVDLMDADT